MVTCLGSDDESTDFGDSSDDSQMLSVVVEIVKCDRVGYSYFFPSCNFYTDLEPCA